MYVPVSLLGYATYGNSLQDSVIHSIQVLPTYIFTMNSPFRNSASKCKIQNDIFIQAHSFITGIP